jgi:hypothetical protein
MSVWCVVVCGRLRGEKGREGMEKDSTLCPSVYLCVSISVSHHNEYYGIIS